MQTPAQRAAQKRYRAKHPERVRASQQAQRAKDPEAHRKYMREYNAKYREDNKARIAEVRAASRPQRLAKSKEYYAANKAANRAQRYVRMYGLPLGQYEMMLAAQGGACAICRGTDPGHKLPVLPVDHDHATGKVRGLLCSPCNQMLGRAQDSVTRLKSAIEYLTRAETRDPLAAT